MSEIQLHPVQPAEALAYFRQKGYRIGFDHRDVWQQEHQAAFTVAKAMHVDLLREIRAEVDAALANGTTFKTFQDALMPKLAARGWLGKQEMLDPLTGETKVVQLGSPRRLATAFDTNLATAYSEGQWERIQRNAQIFPFLEYVRSASLNPRHSHLAYAGLVLPAADPFWQSHLPIKEYGCKCSVIQHTQRMLDREGLKVGTAPQEVMRPLTNKRTGEVMEVPTGVDPAFHYPPGGRRANLGKFMMDKADQAGAATAARVLADGARQWAPLVQTEFSEFVGRYAAGERRELGTRRVVGAFSPDVVAGLKAAGAAPEHATVAVRLSDLKHLLRDPANVQFVSTLPELLLHAGEVWTDGKEVVVLSTSDEPGRVAKVAMRLDAPTMTGISSNSVVSMQLIRAADFDRSGWMRLDKRRGAP